MKAKVLTDAMIRRLPAPATGRVAYPDRLAPGLMLLINAAGDRRWMLLNYVGGRQAKMAVGTYPLVSLAEARDLARAAREQARGGADPRAARAAKAKAAVEEAERATAGSFAVVAGQYIAALREGKLAGGGKRTVTAAIATERESMIRRLILPAIGSLPLDKIKPAEIARMLAKIEAAGGPVDRALQTTRLTFKFAASRGLFSGPPPTAGMTRRQAQKVVGRALTDAEIRAVWEVAGGLAYPYGHAIRLLLLTGQRRDEVGAARWTDVDWERKLLLISADRAKNRAGVHEVPLSDQALGVLTEAREAYDALRLGSGFVFANGLDNGSLNGWSAVSRKLDRDVRATLAGMTPEEIRAMFRDHGHHGSAARAAKAAALERVAAVDVQPWRIHDLRHTVVSRLQVGEENAEGETTFAVPIDVVQAIVGHRLSMGTTAVYDHSDLERKYRLRKRDGLSWWGRKLAAIVDGSAVAEVVQLGRR